MLPPLPPNLTLNTIHSPTSPFPILSPSTTTHLVELLYGHSKQPTSAGASCGDDGASLAAPQSVITALSPPPQQDSLSSSASSSPPPPSPSPFSSHSVSFHTSFGSDSYGLALNQHLATRAPALRLHNSSNLYTSTGHCLCLTSNASVPPDRTFLTCRGAMDSFLPPSSSDLMRIAWASRRHVHVSGFFNMTTLVKNPALLRATLEPFASENNNHLGSNSYSTTSLVPQFDATGKNWKQVHPVMEFLDYMFCSEVEAKAISGEDEPAAIASFFTMTGKHAPPQLQQQSLSSPPGDVGSYVPNPSPVAPRFTVVTLGPSGSLVFKRGVPPQTSAPSFPPPLNGAPLHPLAAYAYLYCPAAPLKGPVVDTTGCGDAFVAGFLQKVVTPLEALDNLASNSGAQRLSVVETMEKNCILKSIRWGNACGAACALSVGASAPLCPSQILSFYNALGGDKEPWPSSGRSSLLGGAALGVAEPRGVGGFAGAMRKRVSFSGKQAAADDDRPLQAFVDEGLKGGKYEAAAHSTPCWAFFDYDKTLAQIEVGPYDITSSDTKQVIDRCFGSEARLEDVKVMLRTLRHQLGVNIAVLSFNSNHTIKKSFKVVSSELLTLFGSDIYGFENLGTDSIGMTLMKSDSIKTIVGDKTKPENVLFVDDSPSNIKDMRHKMPQVFSLHVKADDEGGGMTREDMKEVLSWAMVKRGFPPP